MNYNKSQRQGLMGAVAALGAVAVFLQARIDPLRRQPAIEPPNAVKATQGLGGAALPFEYSLGAVSGFRQVIAGLLWVRTDSFFHEGNYDAILPMIRMITWLDPNWIDVYATGAWHLMYNFTDTDQRSDRRYLPAGIALLNEGIANNPRQYDVYKEKGWNNFDKIKNYDEAALALEAGLKNDPKADVTQVNHLLAHAYERAGKYDEAIAAWDEAIRRHKAYLDDPKATPEEKTRAGQGISSATKNRDLLLIRRAVRPLDTKPPIDTDFKARVVRVSPRKLEISGSWNQWGSKAFDAGTPDKPGKGILIAGPIDGARVDVRLQDAGYKMPAPKEFSFQIDQSVTLMQEQISTHDGKQVKKGELFVYGRTPTATGTVDRSGQELAIYGFAPKEDPNLGIPIAQALTSGAYMTPLGRKQLVTMAYPVPYQQKNAKPIYSDAEVGPLFAKLKGDAATIAKLNVAGVCVATRDVYKPGVFKREIDMSKDPGMYSFSKDKYELILSINPRLFPPNVQDRMGASGEGLTDKRFLDTKTMPGDRMIRRVITLTKDQLTGEGQKVLVAE